LIFFYYIEERRFNDLDFPKLEAEVLWQFESEIRFSIKKKASLVREGFLEMMVKKRPPQQYYVVLDMIERYVACYLEVCFSIPFFLSFFSKIKNKIKNFILFVCFFRHLVTVMS
jgi:hypothetical protein